MSGRWVEIPPTIEFEGVNNGQPTLELVTFHDFCRKILPGLKGFSQAGFAGVLLLSEICSDAKKGQPFKISEKDWEIVKSAIDGMDGAIPAIVAMQLMPFFQAFRNAKPDGE